MDDVPVEMTWEIRFGGDPEDVLVTTAGAASLDAMNAMGLSLVSDRRFRPGMSILLDHRSADFAALDPDDVFQRAARLADGPSRAAGEARVAVVVSAPAAFGVFRMLTAHGEALGAPHEVEPFYTLEEARAWLAAAGE